MISFTKLEFGGVVVAEIGNSVVLFLEEANIFCVWLGMNSTFVAYLSLLRGTRRFERIKRIPLLLVCDVVIYL